MRFERSCHLPMRNWLPNWVEYVCCIPTKWFVQIYCNDMLVVKHVVARLTSFLCRMAYIHAPRSFCSISNSFMCCPQLLVTLENLDFSVHRLPPSLQVGYHAVASPFGGPTLCVAEGDHLPRPC